MNLPLRHHLTLLLTLAAFACLMLAGAGAAQANPSQRISCDIYATNQVDPIARMLHMHHQFGNTGTTNDSTYESLRANRSTSCANAPYLTSAGWFPVERYEPVLKAILYYREPGTGETVPVPEGLQMVAGKKGLSYNCGAEPLNATATQASPPYGCTQNWATHMRFQNCWNGFGLTKDAVSYGVDGSKTVCPASHPVRIVEVNMTITHKNLDGKVPNPLRVSMGTNSWGTWDMMHADYFFAPQDQFNVDVDLDGDGEIEPYDNDGDGRYEPWDADGDAEKNLAHLCVLDAPETLAYAGGRCRADGLLSAHVRELHNYYDNKPVPTG